MSRRPTSSAGFAALRPWPVGPPRRGRAPHGEAGGCAPRSDAGVAPMPATSAQHPGGQATAPAGGLAWNHPIYSA